MMLRPRKAPGRKDMAMRVLLASIGLGQHAADLESELVGIAGLSRFKDAELKKLLPKTNKPDRTKMISAAIDYVERQLGQGDAQAQLESDIFREEDFEDFEDGELDFQAELDALKNDALFAVTASPGKDPHNEDTESESSSEEEDEAPPPPKPKPAAQKKVSGKGPKAPVAKAKAPVVTKSKAKEPQKKAASAAAKKGAKDSHGAGGGKGKGNGSGKGNGADKAAAVKEAKQEKVRKDKQEKSRKAAELKRQRDEKSKAKGASGTGDKYCFCVSRGSMLPTLHAIRTIISVLFTFYCANWGIAGMAKWLEYTTGTNMEPQGFLISKLLFFAVPRPPLYPVPLYLVVNALVDVVQMWAEQDGRFAADTPSSVKVIGVSLYACDIGAVLYGGCFLLTAVTHCFAFCTGRPMGEFLLADEFMLPRPPMPALLGYGVVMLGCVILEQFQIWFEALLYKKGGFRKFVRNHGVHIVLLFILLPIVGTFLAGIGVFLGGMMDDIGKQMAVLWSVVDDSSSSPNRNEEGTALSRFFGPAFGRDTYIKFTYGDIEKSFREIDSDQNALISAGEFTIWLRMQAWLRLDDRAKRLSVGDAMVLAAKALCEDKAPLAGGHHGMYNYSCYCQVVVGSVEEYYTENYNAARHAPCERPLIVPPASGRRGSRHQS